MYDTPWQAERQLRSWRVRGTSALLVPPVSEPLSLETFKLHANLRDPIGDDEGAQLYISAARSWLEQYTGRALFEQTWTYTLEAAPCAAAAIFLPKAPAISVTSVKSYSVTDVATTFSNANYFVDLVGQPARILLHDGIDWPTGLRLYNGVVVEYKAGYGTEPEDVPADLRQAIALLAAHWYQNREGASDRGLTDIPFGVKALADPYRLMLE